MISAWWLVFVIPACTTFGLFLGAALSSKAQADNCANCQYNCLICNKKDKEAK